MKDIFKGIKGARKGKIGVGQLAGGAGDAPITPDVVHSEASGFVQPKGQQIPAPARVPESSQPDLGQTQGSEPAQSNTAQAQASPDQDIQIRQAALFARGAKLAKTVDQNVGAETMEHASAFVSNLFYTLLISPIKSISNVFTSFLLMQEQKAFLKQVIAIGTIISIPMLLVGMWKFDFTMLAYPLGTLLAYLLLYTQGSAKIHDDIDDIIDAQVSGAGAPEDMISSVLGDLDEASKCDFSQDDQSSYNDEDYYL